MMPIRRLWAGSGGSIRRRSPRSLRTKSKWMLRLFGKASMMGSGGVGNRGYRFTGVFGSYTDSSGHGWMRGFMLTIGRSIAKIDGDEKYSDDFTLPPNSESR